MTEPEMLKHIESLFAQMFDRMDNVESRIFGIEKDFVEYCEHNPKADEQWAEQRLRCLEIKVKEIRHDMNVLFYDMNILFEEKSHIEDKEKSFLKDVDDLDDALKKQLENDLEWAASVQKILKHKD